MRHPVIPTTLFRTCPGCGAKIAARTPAAHCPTQERVIADATRAVEVGHLPEAVMPLSKLDDFLAQYPRRAADRRLFYGTFPPHPSYPQEPTDV